MKVLIAALNESLRTGKAPQLPAGGELLWLWFIDLNRTRTYHNAGPNPISYCEIEAYARLRSWPLRGDHVASIRAMDEAFLEHAYTKPPSAPEGVKTLPPISEHPMTGGMFDAMFG